MKTKCRSRLWKGLLIAALILVTVLLVYYHNSPLPVPTQETLRKGVEYQRLVRFTPRQMMIHVLTINLNTKGIRFLVTPPDAPNTDQPLKARTTSQFLEEFDLDIAVNGDGFSPWWSHTLADYYPHVGDPVAPCGDTVSRGDYYWHSKALAPTLYISSRNDVSFDAPSRPFNAISGETLIVKRGVPIEGLDNIKLHPRTAIGFSKNGKFLYILVIDGRQLFYSGGITLAELADLMIAFGADFAMNLDGGGSSTLVVRGADGQPRILNSPIDLYIPGRERPIANHLGIYFKK